MHSMRPAHGSPGNHLCIAARSVCATGVSGSRSQPVRAASGNAPSIFRSPATLLRSYMSVLP